MVDRPNMSDTNLLLTVEDLINISMGPITENKVNFKMLQTVLHILARQLRMLEVKVEIRPEVTVSKKRRKGRKKSRDVHGSPQRTGKGRRSSRRKDRSPTKESEDERSQRGTSTDRGSRRKYKDVGSEDDKSSPRRRKGKGAGSEEDKGSPRKKKGHRRGSAKRAESSESSEDDERSRGGDWKENLDGGDPDLIDKLGKGRRKSKKSMDQGQVGHISVTEVERDKQKILVVEPGRGQDGSSERMSRRKLRVGSVEVVSRDELASLTDSVRELRQLAGPFPAPTMPDNPQLMAALARGSATLTDAMHNMQITARVDAAEKALLRLISMLTTLVSSGVLPRELADKAQLLLRQTLRGLSRKKSAPTQGSKSPRSAYDSNASGTNRGVKFGDGSGGGSVGTDDDNLRLESASDADCITGVDLEAALESLREEMNSEMSDLLSKLQAANAAAAKSALALADKIEQSERLESELAAMNALVSDYFAQLSGLQEAFLTQITCFEDQLSQVKADLVGGLKTMENATGNTETAAVTELTERYEELVQALETANTTNEALHTYQASLEGQLLKLVEAIQLLQEQKNDRDELLDGLRDKADASRLQGLLREELFLSVKQHLELQIKQFHDKFLSLDFIWLEAIKNLTYENNQKAELFQLQSTKDQLEQYLKDLESKIHHLAMVVGEPEAAILTRKLAKDGLCGACMIPAHMWPTAGDPLGPRSMGEGAPGGAEGEPCWMPAPQDHRSHICRRWCGGSHTLLPASRALPELPRVPDHQPVSGYGDDGRMYMFEAAPHPLRPCNECNPPELPSNTPTD